MTASHALGSFDFSRVVVIVRGEHLNLSALIWLAAALIWRMRLLRQVATPDRGH